MEPHAIQEFISENRRLHKNFNCTKNSMRQKVDWFLWKKTHL